MADNEFTPENVVVVGFSDDSTAFEALTTLKELDSQGQLRLVEGAVVTRGDDGSVDVKDQVGDETLIGTASGGLIGLIIGILGGPLGVLLGGATGLLIGSLFDMDDADETDSVLSEVSRSVKVGHNTLLAQVVEQSPEVMDAAMARLSGTVVRRSVDDVEDEIAAAEDAQLKAEHEARKELRKARVEESKADAHAKVEKMKERLHPTKAGAGA